MRSTEADKPHLPVSSLSEFPSSRWVADRGKRVQLAVSTLSEFLSPRLAADQG